MKAALHRKIFALAIALFVFVVLQSKKDLDNSIIQEPRYKDTENAIVVNHSKTKNYQARVNIVCGDLSKDIYGHEWIKLCQGGFLESVNKVLSIGSDVHVVQIGAHVGFEENDPFATGVAKFLDNLSEKEKSHFHWTFVEPSPPNFDRLMLNLKNRSGWCDLRGINAAVVADGTNGTADMVFNSFSPDIDPETGFDSRSNKTLPPFITQVSSFSMAPLNFNRRVFSKIGLRMEDYVVKSNVTIYPYSELMERVTHGGVPQFVLIDTEGFDCNIILGISLTSKYLPPYLVFEDHQCKKKEKEEAYNHLKRLGYSIVETIEQSQNAIAFWSNLQE